MSTPVLLVVTALVGAVAWYVATDPLQVSMRANINGGRDFQPKRITYGSVDEYSVPRDRESKLRNAQSIMKGRDEFNGPESVAFDLQGRGPYTGIADGRVLRFDGLQLGWTTFAWTAHNRSEVCMPKNPAAPNFAFEPICGRPLGLRFHKQTGELWIADAYFGIMKVGPQGGLAEVVISHIDGVPLTFTNDLDFDHDGILYFTESSTKWPLNEVIPLVLEGDNTGRFIKYDPTTKEITVLINNLAFANGVATSKDGTFVVVAETITGRLVRYWLKGEKAGTHETFTQLPAFVDNVRCNEAGDFWVALGASSRSKAQEFLYRRPWLCSLLVSLPIPQNRIRAAVARPEGVVMRVDPYGHVKEALEDQTGKYSSFSEATEHDGKLYLGSVFLPQLVVYPLKGGN